MSATEWKFVPVKPNEKQAYQAAFNLCNEFGEVFVREHERFAMAVYDALLAAAPVPPSVESLLENWTPSDQQAFAKFRDQHFPGEMDSYAIQSLGSAWKDGQANAAPQPAAHLTIPGALEWDGDNGTHGADGESSDNRDNKPEPTPSGEGMARLMRAYELGEFADEGGSATVEAMSCESFDNNECSEHQFESYTAGYQQAIYEQAAPLLHEVGRLNSFRMSYMEWSDKTEWVQKSAHWSELGKHRADVIAERFESLRAQLANTEQSRRSFFDLSQDLEKRLAERDALLQMFIDNSDDGDVVELSRHALSAITEPAPPAEEDPFAATEAPYVPLSAAEVEAFMSMGDGNKAKPKTCIECDQPYCHGVCVERGDQDYDRDQAAKGGDDE